MSDERPDLARPTIGLSTSELRVPERVSPLPQGEPARRELALGLVYVNAIARAGGLPVILPPLPPSFAASLLDAVDGLCVPGGPDIHPRLYGQEPHAALGPTEDELDAFEVALVTEALERDMPVLGICRGAQMINVATGGTLHQHLPACVEGALPHRQDADLAVSTHAVRVAEGSRLPPRSATTWPRSTRCTTRPWTCSARVWRRWRGRQTGSSRRSRAPATRSCWASSGTPRAWSTGPRRAGVLAAFVAAAAERRGRALAGRVA